MQMQKAINSYIKYIKAEKNFSPLTAKEYERDLQMFAEYLVKNLNFITVFDVKDVSRFEASEFLNDLVINRGNEPSTRNRKLYCLSSFFKYLVGIGIVNKNPIDKISASKVEKKAEPIYMKLAEARDYIKTIEQTGAFHMIRDLAIIKTFLTGGLRVSELVELDLDHIDMQECSIKFFGKGNKERFVPLNDEAMQAIYEYLPIREKTKYINLDGERALFRSQRGTRISVKSVQVMVKKYAKLAGLKNWHKITPHKLRHTFATMLYRETKDLT